MESRFQAQLKGEFSREVEVATFVHEVEVGDRNLFDTSSVHV